MTTQSLWMAVLAGAILAAAALWLFSTQRVQRNASLPEEKNPVDIES